MHAYASAAQGVSWKKSRCFSVFMAALWQGICIISALVDRRRGFLLELFMYKPLGTVCSILLGQAKLAVSLSSS